MPPTKRPWTEGLPARRLERARDAEGGSTGATHRTHASESPLHEWVTVVRDPGAPRWGYFVRAETMHGLFTWLDTHPGPTDPAFHAMSHGESFVTLLGTRRDVGRARRRVAPPPLPRRATAVPAARARRPRSLRCSPGVLTGAAGRVSG